MKGDPTQYLGTVSVPLPAPPAAEGLHLYPPPAPLPPAAAPPAQLAGTQGALQQAQLQASFARLSCFCRISVSILFFCFSAHYLTVRGSGRLASVGRP